MKEFKNLAEIEEILRNRVKDISLMEIPHYSKLKGIVEASNVIKDFIDKEKFITIVGDYDVDGITSSAILEKFFRDIGYKNFEIIIPNRFIEGYGINPKVLERVSKRTELIITVDNGIASFETFEILKEKKITTILTDHHTPKTDEKGNKRLPVADIIINPKVDFDYPFKEICGAEVAWYLLAGLKNEANFKIDLREYLDYVSLAIIADMVPLTDMNRVLTNTGLKIINLGIKPFSRVLKDRFGKIDSSLIGFQIAPRLNASGRMAEADIGKNFLLAESYEEALFFFQKLESLNQERKETQEYTMDNIKPIIHDRFVYVVDNLHPGVVGIVANKISREYKKPCIVFTKDEETGLLKGSGRSVGNVDLFELIYPLKGLYETFGGHPTACGISIREKDFEKFTEAIDKRSKEIYSDNDYFIDQDVLGEINFSLINNELLDLLDKYEPYGYGNPFPSFVAKNVEIVSVENIKNKYLKFIFRQNNRFLEGILFDNPIIKEDIIKEMTFMVKRGMRNEPNLIIKNLA